MFGRLAPELRSFPLDHSSITDVALSGAEFTPLSPASGGYFPLGVDVGSHRYVDCYTVLRNPSRQSSVQLQAQAMHINYPHTVPNPFASLPTEENALPATNLQPMGYYSFDNYVASPPLSISTSGYPINQTGCESSDAGLGRRDFRIVFRN
ncbi:hypothetical protein F4819DRAFT_445077 [Hypoxylon fuscum]|nr:hypothetical protein F4819DRAFT_445077 [Hypoxylon fuscum]